MSNTCTIFEVYTDGSFFNNKGGWANFWIDRPDLNKSGKLNPNEKQSCARAEVRAFYEALVTIDKMIPYIPGEVKVIIYSDSIYCVKGYNEWMHDWIHIDFKKKEHTDLLKEIYKIYEVKSGIIEVKHVPSHKGIYGNEKADKMAKLAVLAKIPAE